MKRFRFPLESVRAVREQKERQAMQNYAGTIRAAQALAQRLQALNLELAGCRAFLSSQLAAGGPSRGLTQTRAFLSTLEESQARLEAELRAAQIQLQRAWQALLAATRDRDGLDHYRHRLFRAHAHGEVREEQKVSDEVGGRLAGAALTPRLQPSTRRTLA